MPHDEDSVAILHVYLKLNIVVFSSLQSKLIACARPALKLVRRIENLLPARQWLTVTAIIRQKCFLQPTT